MMREPTSWAISAIGHDKDRRRNRGIDDLYRRGCLTQPVNASCVGNRVGYPLFDGQHVYLIPSGGAEAWAPRASLLEAKRRLGATVFGLAEYFAASECLMSFQFGHLPLSASCNCASQTSEAIGVRSHTKKAIKEQKVGGTTVQQEAMLALLKVKSGAASALYAHALSLFLARIEVAERATATGMGIICSH